MARSLVTHNKRRPSAIGLVNSARSNRKTNSFNSDLTLKNRGQCTKPTTDGRRRALLRRDFLARPIEQSAGLRGRQPSMTSSKHRAACSGVNNWVWVKLDWNALHKAVPTVLGCRPTSIAWGRAPDNFAPAAGVSDRDQQVMQAVRGAAASGENRGRDDRCRPPPAQTRTGPIKASGSYLE